MRKIGLALGGGGAKGLCHIEFIKVLDELKVKPAVISGTSIGAIVGAFYAAGISGVQMESILKKIKLKDLGKMVDFSILNQSGLIKGKGIEDFFYKYIPVSRFDELQIPLKIVATDFWNRSQVVFDSGELIPAVRASMSVPGIFKPVRIKNRTLIDGGAVNPVPYDIIRNECDILIAIDVSGTKTPQKSSTMPTIFESVMGTFEIMEATIVKNKPIKAAPDIYVKPILKNIQILDFHRSKEIIQSVKEDADYLGKELQKRMKKRFRLF